MTGNAPIIIPNFPIIPISFATPPFCIGDKPPLCIGDKPPLCIGDKPPFCIGDKPPFCILS